MTWDDCAEREERLERELEEARQKRTEAEAKAAAMHNMALSTGHYTADQELLVAHIGELEAERNQLRHDKVRLGIGITTLEARIGELEQERDRLSESYETAVYGHGQCERLSQARIQTLEAALRRHHPSAAQASEMALCNHCRAALQPTTDHEEEGT